MVAEEGSSTKNLSRILSIPSNRSCADCRVTLIDASQVYASVSKTLPPSSPPPAFNTFRHNHAQFSPVPVAEDPPVDPALLASLRTGGHGVLVCALCAAAHKLCSDVTPLVHYEGPPLLGNAHAQKVLEAYKTPWPARPNAKSSLADRLTFVRAKYQALAWVLPKQGPVANRAWKKIVELHPEWQGLWGADWSIMVPNQSSSRQWSSRHLLDDREGELPDRLVDYFCVVQASMEIDASSSQSMEDVRLVPQIGHCFPAVDADFPPHVATLVWPDGCAPSLVPQSPSWFSLVLTCADGNRLYGGVLRIYDTDHEGLYEQLEKGGHEIPKDLQPNDVVYLPKALVILSHYPFFDVWRKFLLQIYRITLVEAPLPIERFIANFCAEVPLPPPGKIRVQVAFTNGSTPWTIARPPVNQLPLANFSFQPLFASLSVGNALLIHACLLLEYKVALVSSHYALLTPVAEALLSLMFPFHWQGMYIPILPYHMLDILDAPVPYLVGLHRRYMQEENRPPGVILVDLDEDVVHLGVDEDTGLPRDIPALPEKDAQKLRSKLDLHASSVYLTPDTDQVGTITSGKGSVVDDRPAYARALMPDEVTRRRHIFAEVDRAYNDNELLAPLSGFLSEDGQFQSAETSEATPATPKATGTFRKRMRFLRLSRNRSTDSDDDEENEQLHDLLSIVDPQEFSSEEIRQAYLRFFVSILRDYRMYLSRDSFRRPEFLASLNVSSASLEFVEGMLQTQMFSRFVEDRLEGELDPEVLFFDESINAKMNRSKRVTLSGLAKKTTSFLDDTSNVTTEAFTPPPPSNWGLPADGRTYHYGKFPDLDPELFGTIRPPKEWPQARRMSGHFARRASISAQASEQALVTRALRPVIKTPSAINKVTRKGVRSLESAIGALSSPFVTSAIEKTPRKPRHRSRKSTGSVDESVFSDVTMSEVMDISDDVMSTAEEIVLSCRRRQSILIGIFIKLQAAGRAYLVQEAMKLPTGRSSTTDSLDPAERRLSAHASRIQSIARLAKVRRQYTLSRQSAKRIQAAWRGHRVVFAYAVFRQTMAKAQAVCRGFVVRISMARLIETRMTLYREHVFILWRTASTSLAFRTKFWPYLATNRILNMVVAENEIQRLWKELQIKAPSTKQSFDHESNRSLFLGSMLGVSDSVHRRCTMVGQVKATRCESFNRSLHEPQMHSILSMESAKGGGSSAALSRNKTRLNAEHAQLYDRLASIGSDKLLDKCKLFHIPLKRERKKKMSLIDALWNDVESADQSAVVMLQLFPELKDSTTIIYREPSKKGIRRFHSSEIPEALDKSMMAHNILETLIQKAIFEVASYALTEIPALSIQLAAHEYSDRALARSLRQRQAIMKARCTSSWKKCRYMILREFFALPRGKLAHRRDPAVAQTRSKMRRAKTLSPSNSPPTPIPLDSLTNKSMPVHASIQKTLYVDTILEEQSHHG